MFLSLEAVINQVGEPFHQATFSLGDRVRIESLEIIDGQIVLEMVTHGPEDPMCCPTQLVRNTYALAGGALQERRSEAIGEKPAEEVWKLQENVWYWHSFVDMAGKGNIQVDDPTRYTLKFLTDGLLFLTADCNNGSGRYQVEGSSVTLQVGPITAAACEPESLDQKFLFFLGQVVSFVVDEGTLYLNLMMDAGDMVFVSEAAP